VPDVGSQSQLENNRKPTSQEVGFMVYYTVTFAPGSKTKLINILNASMNFHPEPYSAARLGDPWKEERYTGD
jgi:hypothetical protein